MLTYLITYLDVNLSDDDDLPIATGKRVCELGAGCGLPSVALLRHADPACLLATDLFKHTMENLG